MSLHVSLVLIPDAIASSVTGIYDVLTCFPELASIDGDVPAEPPFTIDFVGTGDAGAAPPGLALARSRPFQEIPRTDIVIAPALMVRHGRWVAGRYPGLVEWLREVQSEGALLTSACSGVLLLAETGLLDGLEATIHWAYVRTFKENFPKVRLRQERVLVTSGEREQFVMSGASASWHDLVLYLVARTVDPTAAQAIAKFMMLQWHTDGQAPYEIFQPVTDHGDAVVANVQRWIEDAYATGNPVEEMVHRSGLPERTFNRRFKQATGLTPVGYVQRLRIREAKRRLERTDASVERIGFDVGYQDPASFRRTFKRIAGMPPGSYRRKFVIPEYARPPAAKHG